MTSKWRVVPRGAAPPRCHLDHKERSHLLKLKFAGNHKSRGNYHPTSAHGSYLRFLTFIRDDIVIVRQPEVMSHLRGKISTQGRISSVQVEFLFRLSWKWTIEPFVVRTPKEPGCFVERASGLPMAPEAVFSSSVLEPLPVFGPVL